MTIRQSRPLGLTRRLLIILAVLVVAAGAVVWWLSSRPTSAPKPLKPGWLQYQSTHSSVGFQYPANWKLTIDPIPRVDKMTLESVTLTPGDSFSLHFQLGKTFHGTIVNNASCVAPPKVSVYSQLPDNLNIGYAVYGDSVDSTWIYSAGKPPSGYGYATGQCRVRGDDFVALPHDLYATFSTFGGSASVAGYFSNPDTQTALAIFKTFSR